MSWTDLTPKANGSPGDSAATAFLENASEWTITTDKDFKDLTNERDAWWFIPPIQPLNWDQSFPYQLRILEEDKPGHYVQRGNFIFTLPIPPEALSVQTPYAIQTHVTLGGIIEEHNAAPIKMISLSGTTGVMPVRPSMEVSGWGKASSLGIFGGVISNAQQTTNAALDVASDFSGVNKKFQAGVLSAIEMGDGNRKEDLINGTGYYFFKSLEVFFENYVWMKKHEKGRNLRLAWCQWKDQYIYLVTPVVFSVDRRADRPLEYRYSLQFKAWKRVNPASIGNGLAVSANSAFKPAGQNPNILAHINNAINDARRTVSNAIGTIQALPGDLGAVMETMRLTAVFVKELLNIPLTIADLPTGFAKAAQPMITEWISVKTAYGGAGAVLDQRIQGNKDAINDIKNGWQDPKSDLNLSKVLFDDPLSHFEIFDAIKPADLKLPIALNKQVTNEKAKASLKVRRDFEGLRDGLQRSHDNIADAFGVGGGVTYNTTYNRSALSQMKLATNADFQLLYTLNDAILEMSRMAASSTINQQRKISSVEYVAGLARSSGIAFQIPRSKYAVPFPYGYTLDMLARLYLGDEDRWMEIAALNGLMQPYVDEVGFDLPLLANGVGNTFIVADATNLIVGQQVWLSSPNASRTIRRILRIETFPTYSVITVDGAADLDAFKVADGAVAHAFLPDTVNSQQLIYIPSDQDPATNDLQTKAIPGISEYDEMINVGGIEQLLTPTGDLAMTSDGDNLLSIGLTNIIQDIRLKMSTTVGGLMSHPEYGLGIEPGTNLNDVDVPSLTSMLRKAFANDPAIQAVTDVAVNLSGPVLLITMSILVKGVPQTIPITVAAPSSYT